jgi:hypothetical protein
MNAIYATQEVDPIEAFAASTDAKVLEMYAYKVQIPQEMYPAITSIMRNDNKSAYDKFGDLTLLYNNLLRDIPLKTSGTLGLFQKPLSDEHKNVIASYLALVKLGGNSSLTPVEKQQLVDMIKQQVAATKLTKGGARKSRRRRHARRRCHTRRR